MNNIFKKFLPFYIIAILLLPTIIYAANGPEGTTPFPSDQNCTGNSCSLTNPLGDPKLTPQAFIGRIINAALGIVGSLALVMFIFGGFTWMMAAGSAEKVKKGRDIMVWAALGLVVIFSSYALTKFIIENIRPR